MATPSVSGSPGERSTTDLLARLQAALVDRYTIERELGRGGMATVYLAEDLKHHRRVALKVLKPELAAALGPERFLREIELTARLTHPHILPLHDSGEAGGFLYYTMPYVEGESLHERLARETQLPLDDALQIAREVADALSYAHAHDVLHRDIKPGNILLESGHAVVADFGIAKALRTAVRPGESSASMAIGTPVYMSPEQAAGGHAVDGRGDVYALGCVLYEMLAGAPPFQGPTAEAIRARHAFDPVPSLHSVRPTVPASVEATIVKALAKVPADRFATAAKFAAALTTSSAVRPDEAAGTKPQARRIAALVTGLLAVAMGVSVLLKTGVLRPSRESGGPRLTSLAVLPLVNLSGDSAQEYFADGMTEALITELDKVSALTVTSRTSAMSFKGKHQRLPEIARQLNVEGIVEGSVLREGGRVRISARLIDARTDRHLWDSTYEREAASVLALQAELARSIASAIGATLTPEETQRLQVSRRVNPQAYDEYLLGMRQAWAGTEASLARAIEHYRRAIELEPSFADPQAGLVDAYLNLTGFYGSPTPKESAPLARAAAEQAVALDPGSAQAHAALAQVRAYWEWRWEEADVEYRRALELNPGLAFLHYKYEFFLTGMGRHGEAVQYALRAVELDPRQAGQWSSLGWVYLYAGRFQESIAAEEKALNLDPLFGWAHAQLAWNYSVLGRHQEAIEAVDRARKEDPRNQVFLGGAVIIHARAGQHTVARQYLDSLLARGGKGWVDSYNLGWAYAWLGESDRALESFNRAIEQRSVALWTLKVEWLPEDFKADHRFHALLRRVNLE